MQRTAEAAAGGLSIQFQSSSGQKAGCNVGQSCRGAELRAKPVSILIRPEGRMQREFELPFEFDGRRFQSSSGQKAGCNMRKLLKGMAQPYPFQSSSGQKAGCNLNRAAAGYLRAEVSILIRPEGRMQLFTAIRSASSVRVHVSILIRPEGRMQPNRKSWTASGLCFNPHPARRPDATSRRVMPGAMPVDGFQSSSGQKAGCNLASAWGILPHEVPVSILIRPEGRMQPVPYREYTEAELLFQSSSGQKAGCNLVRSLVTSVLTTMFQSSSGQKAGCNGRFPVATTYPSGFNPHPARRPDATWPRQNIPRYRPSFNPHPARRPDATLSDRMASS